MNNPNNENDTPAQSTPEFIIDRFTDKLISIKECASLHVSFASGIRSSWAVKRNEEISKSEKQLGVAYASEEEYREFKRTIRNSHSNIICESLLIYAFSSFDAFVGMLLRNMYKEISDLGHKFNDKELTVKKLKDLGNVEAAVNSVIDQDVSALIRKSYIELMSKLETRHGFSTLTSFPNWPVFVEAAQRRNLITHCDGVVSSQYLSICKDNDCQLDASVVEGCKLEVGPEYLEKVLNVVFEVGVMLAHTLWRKACNSRDKQLELESHLTKTLYSLLRKSEYSLVADLGRFALLIPNAISELDRKICRINYAQALKWTGRDQESKKVIQEIDWSGSLRELRLAVAVLQDNYDDAAKIMTRIGVEGELINAKGYRDWPIFKDFRKSTQFLTTFKTIFGFEFKPEVQYSFLNLKNHIDSTIEREKERKNASKVASGKTKRKSSKRKSSKNISPKVKKEKRCLAGSIKLGMKQIQSVS